MNHFYIDFMLRERRKNEVREYERRRFLNMVRTPPGGYFRKLWKMLHSNLHHLQELFQSSGLRTDRKM